MTYFKKSKKIALCALSLIFCLQMSTAYAADEAKKGADPEKNSDYNVPMPLQEIEKLNLPKYYGTLEHPDAPPDYVQPGIGKATSPLLFLLDFLRFIVSGVALIMIFYFAVKMVAVNEEEEVTKTKNGLIFAVFGLVMIQLAEVVVKKMFFGEQGEAFEDITTAQIYGEESVSWFRSIIGMLQFVAGTIAVLVIVIRGITVLTSAGNEEALTKAKNHILYSLAALVVIGVSELVVSGFIFPNKGDALPDVAVGRSVIVMITNYLSGFVAIISFLILVFTGYRFVVSGGDEEMVEKVKKTFVGALIALILSISAFAIIQVILKMEKAPDSLEIIQNIDELEKI